MIDRNVWDQSETLRASVSVILADWGRWSQGGGPRLSYPTHQPFATPPGPEDLAEAMRRKAVDVEQAENAELIISTMASATCHEKGAQLIRWRYVDGLKEDRLIAQFNRHYKRTDSRGMVLGRLSDAEWVFACLLD